VQDKRAALEGKLSKVLGSSPGKGNDLINVEKGMIKKEWFSLKREKEERIEGGGRTLRTPKKENTKKKRGRGAFISRAYSFGEAGNRERGKFFIWVIGASSKAFQFIRLLDEATKVHSRAEIKRGGGVKKIYRRGGNGGLLLCKRTVWGRRSPADSRRPTQ